ncbi:MAG: TetR/AcrR family transcriptional regulator [Pseudomonadales bacterium]
MTANNKNGARLPRPERRQQLLHVAKDVFAEQGFEAASLEQIAELAGISRPILYSHFGDKHGLFEAVIEQEISRLKSVVTQSLLEPGETDQLLERCLRAFFTDMHENPTGHIVVTRDVPTGLSNSGLDQMLASLGTQITDVIVSNNRVTGGEPVTAAIYAHALIGAAMQVGCWWREQADVSVEDVVAATTSLFGNGFTGIRANNLADNGG